MIQRSLAPLLRLYRMTPAAPRIADQDVATARYRSWRLRMFVGFFVGYAVLYFCRKNISNAMPLIGIDLGYSNVQLGLIGTTLYITYGLGKFCNGVLADRANIRVFLATGLIASGLINIWFASLGSLYLLALMWGLNGWFQSMGIPPIARGMTIWFPAQGRATRWAFWTCSHQAGTAVVMAMTAWIATWGSWRHFFYIPAALCIAVGVGLLFLLADTPESQGLAPVSAIEGDAVEGGATDLRGGDYWRALLKHVLLNRNVWVVGLIDLCVYAVRFGTLDWTTKFMIEDKGYEKADAMLRAGFMPAAGVVGVLVLGIAADRLFGTRYRVVNIISLAMLGVCMYGFYAVGPGEPWLDLLFLFGIGFFVEGPQSILGGVGAVDAGGSARVASAAVGLVGILSYTGASLSGVGTGWCIDHFQWAGAYTFWIICCAIGLALCLFVWREKR
ncbi:MAG: MFS transporter [Deltaproteobacteria bacterium]|nr:MFS transporter [Deltaproteobacteria bacterium]